MSLSTLSEDCIAEILNKLGEDESVNLHTILSLRRLSKTIKAVLKSHFTKFNQRIVTDGPVFTKRPIYANLERLKIFCVAQCRWTANLQFNITVLQDLPLLEIEALDTLGSNLYNGDAFALSTVRATSLRCLSLECCLRTPDFGVFAQSPFINTLEHFRAVDCFRLTSLAVVASMTNLLSLSLTGCHLIRSPEVQVLFGLTQLKNLDLGTSPLQNIDGFGAFTNLESLALRGITPDNLDELSIMTSLDTLLLTKCGSGFTMPDLSALGSLSTLHWTKGHITDDLEFLCECTSLTSLNIKSFFDVHSIENLRKLTSLAFLTLEFRTETPVSFLTTFSSLQFLGTYITPSTYPIHNTHLDSFPSIDSLKLVDMTHGYLPLKNIPKQATLLNLSITSWASFTEYGWDEFGLLQTLELIDCPSIGSIRPFAALDELISLRLERCPALFDLRGFEAQYSLTKLEVLDCAGLIDATGCQEMQVLSHLSLRGCMYVTRLGHTLANNSLRLIDITSCDRLPLSVHELTKRKLTVIGDNRIDLG
jgi:hypothetical protein